MPDVRIEVVRTRGHCNADFHEGESFFYKGSQLIATERGFDCLFALATVVVNAGRLRLEKGPIYLSCPDPGTGEGGNVIFRVSPAESL